MTRLYIEIWKIACEMDREKEQKEMYSPLLSSSLHTSFLFIN